MNAVECIFTNHPSVEHTTVLQVYSFFFIRWWLMGVVSLGLPVTFVMSFLRYTPLLSWFYWGMGAKIGRGVSIGQGLYGMPCVYDYDLIEIGEGSTIEMMSYVMGSDVRGGMLHLGHTRIGAGCFIGMGSVVMPGSVPMTR